MLPGRKDKAFRDSLLRQILRDGGTSVAEDLRPLVQSEFDLKINDDNYHNWNTRVSFALIDLRDEGFLVSPFEELNSTAGRSWIKEYRPGRKPQQVWRLTSAGHAYLAELGEIENEIVALVPIEEKKQHDAFNVTNIKDARRKIVSAIVSRRGQPEFRRQLLAIYNSRCAFTGADAVDALEAAHIVPYRGDYTDHPLNGLLLRADIHTLFDFYLLAVRSEEMTIIVSNQLSDTVYASLNGKRLNLPDRKENWPSAEALDWHRTEAGL